MAFDKKPSTWIPSWSEDGTNITVPIATFSGLTAAEADATTGDIREVVHAIVSHLLSTWNSTASADRPVKMVISKQVGFDGTDLIEQYQFRFNIEVLTTQIASEPT